MAFCNKELEEIKSTSFRQKCGEITLVNNSSIQFTCNYCDVDIQNIRKFLKHVLKEHITLNSEEIRELLEEVRARERKRHDFVTEGSCDEDIPEELKYYKEEEGIVDEHEELQNQALDTDSFDCFLKDSQEEVEKLVRGDDVFKRPDYKCTRETKLLDKFFEEILPCSVHRRKNENGAEKKYINGPNDDIALPEVDFKANGGNLKDGKSEKKKSQYLTSSGCIQCPICHKFFSKQGKFNSHYRQHIEVKERPYLCEYCNARFGGISNLTTHINRHHLGIRPHRCETCDKCFISTSELRIHTYTHTGTKPFQCTICDRRFVRRYHLNLHNRRHFNVRPYDCETCGASFYDRRQLKSHQTRHSTLRPFSCEICGSVFKTQKALTEHKKLHLDVKMHGCQVCSKSFAQFAGLYSHMKSHYKSDKLKTKDEIS